MAQLPDRVNAPRRPSRDAGRYLSLPVSGVIAEISFSVKAFCCLTNLVVKEKLASTISFGVGMSRPGGVGITGIAGPGGGSDEKPVGYVCICVLDGNGNLLARDPQLPGSRDDVRDRSVSVALHMIRRLLLGEDLPV